MSTVEQIDVSDELDAAREERTAASEEWNYLEAAIAAVEQYAILPDEGEVQKPRAGRTMHAGGMPRRPQGRELDRVEVEVVLASLRRRRAEAADRMIAARARHAAALIANANAKLPVLVGQHAACAEELRAARRAAEEAVIEAVARCVALREAAAREELIARRTNEAALHGAPDDRARRAVRDVNGVVARLDADGSVGEVQERPSPRLFGLGADSWLVGHERFGEIVGRAIALGRKRMAAISDSERVEARFVAPVKRRLEQLDAERANNN